MTVEIVKDAFIVICLVFGVLCLYKAIRENWDADE